jgi:hypothetical protein
MRLALPMVVPFVICMLAPEQRVLYYNTNGSRCEGRGSWFDVPKFHAVLVLGSELKLNQFAECNSLWLSAKHRPKEMESRQTTRKSDTITELFP